MSRDELEPWAVGEEVVDTYEAARILGLLPQAVRARANRGSITPCGRRYKGEGAGKSVGRSRLLFRLADIENELDYMKRRRL